VIAELSLDTLPPVGEDWRHAAAQTIARKQDITMEDSENVVVDNHPQGLAVSGGGVPGDDENWQAFDPESFEEDYVAPRHEDDDDDGEGH